MLPLSSPLLIDLYQLTMLQSYLDAGMEGEAVFEFFVRDPAPERSFLIAAGLEQVVEYLETLRFGAEDMARLRDSDRFSDGLLAYLENLRFTGDVWAMPEGTAFFADEPVLQVRAPLPQAQLVESRIINLLHLQTGVASKAARMVLAAGGKTLIDFGLRRAHGAEAGLLAARAAYLAGFDGTATVLAESRFGIPIFGTMAHSFVQAHTDEATAFASFARSHPEDVVLLLDTYDTAAAARTVVQVAGRLMAEGITVKGVRLDSGDLDALARRVRKILDGGGLNDVKILASGNLDEDAIDTLTRAGAPVDGFGIGSRLVTSADLPYLNCAYKLVEYDGRPTWKLSEGKVTWPGAKQVHRRRDAAGVVQEDVMALADEAGGDGEPLLQPVMRDGQRLGGLPSLAAARRRAAAEMGGLPPACRALNEGAPVPVRVSEPLRRLLP